MRCNEVIGEVVVKSPGKYAHIDISDSVEIVGWQTSFLETAV